MQTIDRIIEEGERKIDIRKQLRSFSREIGKIAAAALFTGIIPILIMTGIVPPEELIIFSIACVILCFAIILVIIFRLFYIRYQQHQRDIYGLAKNFRDSNDELVNLHMVSDKRWQSRLNGLEERANYGIMEVDIGKLKILTANVILREMVGYSRKEMDQRLKTLGYAGLIASCVHPDYKHLFEWSDDNIGVLNKSHRVYIRKNDGTYFPAKVKAHTLKINGDRIAQFFVHDLTETDSLKESLEGQSKLLAELTCNLLGLERDRNEANYLIDLMKEEGEAIRSV